MHKKKNNIIQKEYKEYVDYFNSGAIHGDRPMTLGDWEKANKDRFKDGRRIKMW